MIRAPPRRKYTTEVASAASGPKARRAISVRVTVRIGLPDWRSCCSISAFTSTIEMALHSSRPNIGRRSTTVDAAKPLCSTRSGNASTPTPTAAPSTRLHTPTSEPRSSPLCDGSEESLLDDTAVRLRGFRALLPLHAFRLTCAFLLPGIVNPQRSETSGSC